VSDITEAVVSAHWLQTGSPPALQPGKYQNLYILAWPIWLFLSTL
jgi:hypothetical protein